MTVSVDPSSVSLLDSVDPDRFLEWTRGADLLFPNLTEGEILTGERTPDRIVEKLLPYYPPSSSSSGRKAALYADGAGNLPSGAGGPVRVEDTTGAGDAFSAGFLAAWLDGEPPAEALRWGACLAGRAVGRVGARPTV
jgi:sugar/nucleoside kinase (ribokinase family)